MPKDYEGSLGDQNTFNGGVKNSDPQSLGDEKTFAGGGLRSSPKSLGDEMTLGGGGEQDDTLDDGMEIVDLSARYKIEGTLGKGGMGEVLLATDTRLDRKVAIKRILGEAARSRTAVNRFLTEAKSIAALNHPNIVQIYDYGRATDGPFLIMEYVDGISLLDKCRGNPLPLEEAVELTCQLCDGLGKAHDAGIIHRDIKPANVLLTKDGTPKLTDFGLAKAETADTGMTMAGAIIGTLDFMPPEQRRDAALTDNRSDLWSLAATLYQLVTGKSPKIIKFNDVPQSLQDVLGKALEDAKEDRYQSAREFKEALRKSLRDSGPDISDLGQGQCPHCGTKNDSTRKFCRNCAKSLEVACLSCDASMPMWEEVCGSCGSKQAPLIDKQRAAMQAQRSSAEKLFEANDFDKAVQIATALRDEPDLRLHQQKSWAEQFIKEVEDHRHQHLERMSALLSEALRHEKAFDYSSAIQTLEQVPELLHKGNIPQHTITVYAVLKRVRDNQTESQRLDKLIRQRVESRQVNGLQAEVDKLLVLHPDRKDLQKLKKQLTERHLKLEATRDEAFTSAQKLMTGQDYEGVLKEIGRIDAFVMQPAIVKLKEQAEAKRDRLQALQKSISAATQQKQYLGLLSKVEECLSLKHDDESIKSLREQLIAREKKNAEQINELVAKAQGLRQSCKFEAASQLLSRIPKELQTQEVEHLIDNCESLLFERQSALAALQKGLTSQKYQSAMAVAQNYRNSLQMEGLPDPEISTLYQACLDGIKAQRETAAVAEQQRTAMKMAGVGAGVFALLLVIGGIGLWTRSLLRAKALASAVQESRWDDVLAMDHRNLAALIGRANQRLVGNPSDPEGALKDIEAAEIVDSQIAGLKELKAKAYGKRALTYAMNGKPPDAEKGLDHTQNLGVNDSAMLDAKLPTTVISTPPSLTNSIKMQLKLIPAGKFRMGEESHEVTLTRPYYMGVYEVTQEQYELVMRENPSHFKGPQNPVENISWDDAVTFCLTLSALPEEKSAGRVYRLPTEAEWEYACRAGTTKAYSFGDNESELEQYAWFDRNSNNSTYPVGQKKANPWGLYDMHGNVREWCRDLYDVYPSGAITDPQGPSQGSSRMYRGGSLDSWAAYCRSAYRFTDGPSHWGYHLGVRLALSPSIEPPGKKAKPSGEGTEGASAEQRPELP